MGGHGGLNILPQKRWNVYNFDNREKVRKDEEAAAKEEQLKREQSRRRDTEFRIEQLRQARGLAHQPSAAAPTAPPAQPSSPEPESKSKLNHINLFEGIRVFDPVEGDEESGRARKKLKLEMREMKKMKKEEEARVVLPEDEKYKLGYGVAGKGVKLPWYLSPRPSDDMKNVEREEEEDKCGVGKSRGKKTVEEMREERLRREKREKERERALVVGKGRRDGGFSRT